MGLASGHPTHLQEEFARGLEGEQEVQGVLVVLADLVGLVDLEGLRLLVFQGGQRGLESLIFLLRGILVYPAPLVHPCVPEVQEDLTVQLVPSDLEFLLVLESLYPLGIHPHLWVPAFQAHLEDRVNLYAHFLRVAQLILERLLVLVGPHPLKIQAFLEAQEALLHLSGQEGPLAL